ncbi:ATP-dependent DNA helicase [Cylindrobasidium torrendii FP15055 ss-10]|uniref:DNA 3'-5' helicase n=1 Tax=Cylindrobasidium torrendii FP15055 ss-10 TaxID=1314674 RepID=A0A0D7BK89_9AGAR|nr:ATP-dependent DNA helicase [Cylindrobasidium torrendii FP15055 ss-10]
MKELRAALNANIAETEAEIVACSSQLLEFDTSVSQDTNPYEDEIQTARRQFGLDKFRPMQYAAITTALLGRDMLILMPTGSGKSLTFQLPAACASSGLTVVVTPLLALMSNQTTALRQKGIRVVSTDEIAISPQTFERTLRRAFLQPVILYSTPEKLVGHDRMNHLLDKLHAKGRLTRFAVDEAHCLQWGDWRPALDARFGEHIRRRFPGVPLTALTATANSAQIADIERTLQLHKHLTFRLPSNRANLAYRVVSKPKKADAMQQLCDEFILPLHNGHTGIIYCAYKHTTTEVTAYLVRRGISARHFNGDLSSNERTDTLEAWMSGKFKVVVATNAFGMGIDKRDAVRFVVHFELPRDMTGYIQETGRAGRDGLPADCLFSASYTLSH